MKIKWWQLLICFFAFDFIDERIREILQGEFNLFSDLSNKIGILIALSNFICFVAYPLLSYLTFYFFFPRKKWKLITLGTFIVLIFPIAFRYIIQEIIFPAAFGFSNYYGNFSLLFYLIDNLIFALKYIPIGIAFYFIQYTLYKEKQLKLLSEVNHTMELSLLRSQINPHFLLNSLNNIYSLVYQKSDQALEAITQLSGLLTYSLYEQNSLVSIEKEIESIRQIIHLQSIRYTKKPIIQMDVDKRLVAQKIPPFLFMPIIENAFKHGDLKSYGMIIQLSLKEDRIHFYCENKIGNHQKDEMGGIGLDNIKKRLALLFDQQYLFNIDHSNDFFKVKIEIPFS